MHNAGPDPATSVVATDTLPAGLSVTSAVSSLGSCTISPTIISCAIGTLAVGQNATITIGVSATATGLITNQASVTAAQADPTPANNTVSETTIVSPVAACTAATFSGPFPYPIPPGTSSALRLVDMNHDGRPDIVTTLQGESGGVAVLLSNGNGTFGPPLFTSTGQPAFNFAVADFNGDTHPDVAVAGIGNPAIVRLLTGDGSGILTSTSNATTISSASPIEAFDQDGDGDQDLIMRDVANNLVLQRNDGAANFAAPVTLLSGIGGTVVVADFNEDSRPDIAVALPTSGFAVLLSDTVGGYAAPVIIATAGPNTRVRSVGDLNEDGHVDIVIVEGQSSDGSARVRTFAGNGTGGFGPPNDVNASTRANFTIPGDVNGDGHLDLISSQFTLNSVSVQLGTGTGTFGAPAFFPAPAFSNPVAGDLNGDGRLDIVTGDNGSAIQVLLNACGQPEADLGVTIAESADPIDEGGEVTYTITLTNHSSNAATNVRLTSAIATLPLTPGVELQLLSATSSGGGTLEITDSAAIWTLASVPPTSTTTFEFRVRVDGGTTLFVTSGATSDGADPDSTNSTAFETTVVNAIGRTLVVTNTNDEGEGSLRQAITDSNSDLGDVDRIHFNIPGPGPHTIAPLSPLPTVTQPVIIDGTTEPNFAGTPVIELNGNGLTGNGLTITGGSVTVRGLVINRFGGAGISIPNSSGNVIAGNFIGVDVTGTTARANGGAGVAISSGNNTIGGTTAADRNIISGNQGTGVSILGGGANGNRIQGNYIGTNVTGTSAVPNLQLQSGIHINSGSGNIIGGTAAGAGNVVVSGSSTHAVTIIEAAANGNSVQGNFIGTDATGLVRLAGTGIGVDVVRGVNTVIGGAGAGRNVISGNGTGIQLRTGATGNIVQNNFIGINATGTAAIPNTLLGITISDSATNNTIGGTAAGTGNVISGNTGVGISVSLNSSGNVIQGNLIGTNAAGTAAIGNSSQGIQIDNSVNTQVGGTAAGAGNVISGNAQNGIRIVNVNAVGTHIEGNRIGTNAAGTAAVPNGVAGVTVLLGAGNTTIGGTLPGASNLISGNSGAGVSIASGSANNTLWGNFVGTDVTGALDVGNSAQGVFVDGAGTAVGGVAQQMRNIISGNGLSGVFIGSNASSTSVIGNYIGTTATGASALPNDLDGVNINSVTGTQVAANIIAFNTQSGVRVAFGNHQIAGNSIFANGLLGIDIGPLGVTPNDPGDGDSGPNNLQNFPVLTAAAGGVVGTLNSTANASFVIQFFGNTACDPSGNGEGRTFLGSTSITTDGAGNATIPLFTTTFGEIVTATAADQAVPRRSSPPAPPRGLTRSSSSIRTTLAPARCGRQSSTRMRALGRT